MAYYENYGLYDLEEEHVRGIAEATIRNGEKKQGYNGNMYYFMETGNAEFWAGVIKDNSKESSCFVDSIDIHCGGNCVWEVIHMGINAQFPEDTELTKTILVSSTGKTDHSRGGMVPVKIINPMVLPSLMRDDRIVMQVVANPVRAEYYADEEEYTDAQPESESGKKYLLADGSLLPIHFMINHNAMESGKKEEPDPSQDKLVTYRGTVKKVFIGEVRFEGELAGKFIRCIIGTNFGDLELDHTFAEVPEEMRDNIKVGAVASGICMIQGDVSIYEFQEGMHNNHDSSLRILRSAFETGDTEKLSYMLSEKAVYETDNFKSAFTGKDEIIKRFNYVSSNRKNQYVADFAVVKQVQFQKKTDYEPGTRCIALRTDESEEYESLAFITTDEEGTIEKIRVLTDPRYMFSLETPGAAKKDIQLMN